MKVWEKDSSAEWSDLGPIATAVCSIKLNSLDSHHKFIVCKYPLHSVNLALDFSKGFRIGIDWNSHGQLYLHQDHKPLMYSIQVNHHYNIAIY